MLRLLLWKFLGITAAIALGIWLLWAAGLASRLNLTAVDAFSASPTAMAPPPTVCNASALADCIQAAEDDYASCLDGCVELPPRLRPGCPRGCRAEFRREKQRCNNEFGVCVAGYGCCNGACVNLTNDNQNCGACGNTCSGGQICQNGACGCPAGLTNCSGTCVNLSNDPHNCGACGNLCPSGICQNGACVQVHVRQDVATLSASQIASLQQGFRVMMQRSHNNPNDPTGLTYQASIHATDAGFACPMGDPGTPLWNQCQHGSYFFLSWHRMYLYYFERILRAASGDPNLALPYWNYESSSEQTLPIPFLQPATDCGGNPDANPGCNALYLSGRLMNGGQALGVGDSGVPSWDDSQAFSDTSFEAPFGASFGGNPSPGSPPAPCHFDSGYGDLELQPHNVIHCQVGGKMCDPGMAAQDPIFWLHHAEIDHLWKRWLAQGGGRANPTGDANWMNTTFSFYDETGNVVTLTANGILDTAAQLGYRYDDDPLVPQIRPSAAPAEVQRQFPPTPPERLAVSSRTGIGLSNEIVRVQLKVPPEASTKMNRLLEDKKYKHAIVLNLEGIERVADSSGVYYEIYLNLPADQKPPFPSIYHVGNLGLFLPRHPGMAKPPTISFDLTRSIRALREKKAWNENQMTVSFFAVGLLNPENRQPLPVPPGVRVAIRRISVAAR